MLYAHVVPRLDFRRRPPPPPHPPQGRLTSTLTIKCCLHFATALSICLTNHRHYQLQSARLPPPARDKECSRAVKGGGGDGGVLTCCLH